MFESKRAVGRFCIIFASILLAVVLLIWSFWWVINLSITDSQKGPYHHAAIATSPVKQVEANGKTYCLISWGMNRQRLCVMEENSFRIITLPNYGAPIDIGSDGAHCYVSTRYSEDGILVLDENDQVCNRLLTGEQVHSFLLEKNTVYYVTETKESYFLNEYDRNLGQTKRLFSIQPHSLLNLKGRELWVGGNYELSWTDKIESHPQIAFLSDENLPYAKELKFFYRGEIGTLSLEQGIVLYCQKEKHTYALKEEGCYSFYPQVNVEGDLLYFAIVNRNEEKEDCEISNCICRVNGSKQLCFDLKERKFLLQEELGSGSVYIAYCGQYTSYYCDGKVYRNRTPILEVEALTPYGEYFSSLGHPDAATIGMLSQFYDDGKTLYYSHENFSEGVKEHY